MTRTLADEILTALPDLMRSFPKGPHIKQLSTALSVDRPSARLAVTVLADRSMVKVARRGQAMHILPIDDPTLVCVICQSVFERGRKSKRGTCSKSCAIALSWRNEDTRSQRMASIRLERATPVGRARTDALNRKRWSDPEERRRMSEWNKAQWADPETKIKRSIGIKKSHNRPELREFYSRLRKANWQDPEYRARAIAAAQRAHSTPEARHTHSEAMKARWRDPVQRQKFTEANRKRNADRKRQKSANDNRVFREVPFG